MRIIQAAKSAAVLSILVLLTAASSPAVSGYKTIDTKQLHAMVVDNVYELEAGRNGQYLIIDARPREEYEQAHIFSAVSIPETDFDALRKYLPTEKNALLVVYCNSLESGAGKRWAGKAASVGYTNISVYADSFASWKEKHLPVLPVSSIR